MSDVAIPVERIETFGAGILIVILLLILICPPRLSPCSDYDYE